MLLAIQIPLTLPQKQKQKESRNRCQLAAVIGFHVSQNYTVRAHYVQGVANFTEYGDRKAKRSLTDFVGERMDGKRVSRLLSERPIFTAFGQRCWVVNNCADGLINSTMAT